MLGFPTFQPMEQTLRMIYQFKEEFNCYEKATTTQPPSRDRYHYNMILVESDRPSYQIIYVYQEFF